MSRLLLMVIEDMGSDGCADCGCRQLCGEWSLVRLLFMYEDRRYGCECSGGAVN